MHLTAQGAISELISSSCSFFNTHFRSISLCCLETYCPQHSFSPLWGALPTRAPDYLVLFYFQTLEPPLWIHIHKARSVFKLKITDGDAHRPRDEAGPCCCGPGTEHWLRTACCSLCPRLNTQRSLLSDAYPQSGPARLDSQGNPPTTSRVT